MKKFIKKALFAVISVIILGFSVFAAEDIVFSFENSSTAKGWGYENIRFQFNSAGYLEVYAADQGSGVCDAIMYSPKIDISAEDYRYVVVNMKYSMDLSWSRNAAVYFIPEGQSSWSSANCVLSDRLEQLSVWEFTDLVIDMSKCEGWKGNITQLRFDPFGCIGSFDVKSITLTNTLPKKEEVVVPDTTEQTGKKAGYFEKPNTYKNDFNDVPSDEWYASEVAKAYELGLVGGKGEGIFDPLGNMTVAEAITIASRAKNNYGAADYVFEAKAGDAWYTPYVEYAVNNGIIKNGDFADYNVNITRAQMAYIFANTLPASEYALVNSVSIIPDVKKADAYADAIYKLYNAGIVMGSDAYGTFNPTNNIIRCEAAAIINRIANKESRLAKNLVMTVPHSKNGSFEMKSEAAYFIDEDRFYNKFLGGIPSGWNLNRVMTVPEASGLVPYYLDDISDEYGGEFEKLFPAVNDGVLGLEFGAVIGGNDGAYIAFSNDKNVKSVEVLLEKGEYKVLCADGSYKSTGVKYTSSSVNFNMYVNLSAKSFDLGINGEYAGTYPLAAQTDISKILYGTTKDAVMKISGAYVTLTHNYLVQERFINAPDNLLPYNVKVISEGGRVYKDNTYKRTGNGEGGNVVLSSNAGGKTGIGSEFAQASGNIVFETYIFLPDDVNGAKIALKNGGNDVFFVETKNGSFVSPDGKNIRTTIKNLWTVVRFEADTSKGMAKVKINGKDCGEYAFASAADFVDGYEITYTPSAKAVMQVDSISAFIKLPYPDDYVPEPVVPESDDYYVGINVCSLWRTGIEHQGWDSITAYPEIKPVLGYYDEGSPEVADWEIKMMSEHGIDYQLFCWYADSIVNKPIFRTDFNDALIDGYMNARYSDKMDFAIMWENAVTTSCSEQAFREYVVPYWIEYFFSDERYVKFNNKPLVAIYNSSNFANYFGGVSAAKANLEYLRNECKKAGFDGCEVWVYFSKDYSEDEAKKLAEYGFDGMCVYNWGANGCDTEYQLDKIKKQGTVTTLGAVPTISVGFDYVGWGKSEKRNGLLNPDDFHILSDYVKNDILAKRPAASPYSKNVLISTWNEYGEGTYVMPTERYGFAYLDEVRKAFTNGADHTDVTPDDSQKQRITRMFDNTRQLLRPQLLEKNDEVVFNPYEGYTSVHSITFDTAEKVAALADYASGYTYYSKDGMLFMEAYAGKDPAIFMKSDFKGVSVRQADAIRVRAKIDVEGDSFIQMYFETSEASGFAGDRGAELKIVSGEWHDYIFDMRDSDTWRDKITNIRIDVSTTPYESAEIECIELVKLPEAPDEYTVDINGFILALVKKPEVVGDAVMIPLYPESGVLHRMMSTYNWNQNTKTLTIKSGKHTVELFVGSDTMTVDGVQKKLPAKVYMFDGVPVVPINIIAKALGYHPVEHADKNGISIMLTSEEDYRFVAERVKNQYEFNLLGDAEDWTTQNCSISVSDGSLHGVCTTSDPAIISPTINIKAEDYPTVEVRMKWDSADENAVNAVSVFFRNPLAGISGSRVVSSETFGASSDGEYVTFEIDMTKHIQWYGTITGLRVDPISRAGTFDIDYIRLKRDEDAELREKYTLERELNLDDTIANGDAEILAWNPMISENADVTIAIRDDFTSYCYDVKARVSGAYTNCQQVVKFEPGAKYALEYDIRLVSTTLDETDPELGTTVVVNAVYNEGESLKNHIIAGDKLTIGDGWKHVVSTFTIGNKCTEEGNLISIFLNPLNGVGFNMQLDNIKMYKVK